MNIEIPLGGQIRIIKWDGIQFMPLTLTGQRPLGYFTNFGKAVEKLVKEVANTDQLVDKTLKEDTLSLNQFVNRFERVLSDIKSLTPADFQHPQVYNDTEVMDVEFEEEPNIDQTINDVSDPRREEDDLDGL